MEERDHDLLIQIDERVRNLQDALEELERDMKILMSDRAKLIGYCVGASAAGSLIIKFFWPAAKG